MSLASTKLRQKSVDRKKELPASLYRAAGLMRKKSRALNLHIKKIRLDWGR